MSGDAPRHWLVGVAERAGLSNASSLSIAIGTSIDEAWDKVTHTCGVSEEQLAEYIAEAYHLPLANLDRAEPQVLRLVPENVARQFGVFPIRENYKQLIIATSDPNDFEIEQAIGFASGRTPVVELAPPRALRETLDAAYSPDRSVEHLLKNVADETGELVRIVEDVDTEVVESVQLASGPVVKLTNLILKEAIEQRASDIHLQPGTAGGNVRFRVDGVLRPHMQMPLPALHRVVSRIKVMGKLDIADHLRPQDGRAKIGVGDQAIDLRIATVPSRGGEKAVVRLLRPQETKGLSDIGLQAAERERFQRMLSRRDGIVVVTGPTGSGKTTTLYAALKHLSTEEVNIMTVEDPVEYELSELTQIQVEVKQGVTFASALRAILRQDPDVIFVGEIRDPETAEVAVHASRTGHLVLATLHTNDAVGSIQRLADLGLEKSVVAETLRGALGQRLVRRVCTHCAVSVDGKPNEDEVRLEGEFRIPATVRANGCEQCGQTGFLGRTPLVEVFTMSPQLATQIVAGADQLTLQTLAIAEGMRSLEESGVQCAAQGETTLAELERVLGESERQAAPRGSRTMLAEPPRPPMTTCAPPEPARPSVVLRAIAEETEAFEGDEARALVVDDDGATRTVVRALLEKEGFAVDEAADGAEALECLAQNRYYNFAVLDLDMPNVGGREVLQGIRSSVATAGLPVIVLTGTKDPDAEIELMEQGADDYVRKPIEPARFLVRVKATLRRASV